MPQIERRIRAAARGLAIGHQLGQWSERRWWHHLPEAGPDPSLPLATALADPRWLSEALADPPRITTPGWVPTGVGDLLPLIDALCAEGRGSPVGVSPEAFRELLLRERGRLMPQAVGRTCIELMAEGMNPRIAGLHAPAVLYGCWIAWPVGFAWVGRPQDAWEEAVLLARAQVGGDGVTLAAFLASLIAAAVTPGATWAAARAAALQHLRLRDPRVAGCAEEALARGREAAGVAAGASDPAEWTTPLADPAWLATVSRYPLDLLADFYRALAALEWWSDGPVAIVDLARAVLESSDSRFPAMIVLSVAAALTGTGALPAAWIEGSRPVQPEALERIVDSSLRSVDARSRHAVASGDRVRAAEPRLADRILAGLLAGAAGNSMGAPVEDRDWPWIEARYGVLDRFLEPGASLGLRRASIPWRGDQAAKP